jgi:hypothetical protein
VPTYAWLARFGADFSSLSPSQQAAFLVAVAQFVDDLGADRGFRKDLRVKGVKGGPGIFEMTWADDGRATFECGDALVEGQRHVIWRRVGTHSVLKHPDNRRPAGLDCDSWLPIARASR